MHVQAQLSLGRRAQTNEPVDPKSFARHFLRPNNGSDRTVEIDRAVGQAGAVRHVAE